MSLENDPLVARYFPEGIPDVLNKYFPNGTPKCWREKFPNGAPLSIFSGLRGQAVIEKLKEIFDGEIPKEFECFKDGIPEELKALVHHQHIIPE